MVLGSKLKAMRVFICIWLLALAACGDPGPVTSAPPGAGSASGTTPPAAGLLAVQQGHCAACHSLGEAMDRELAALPAQPLVALASRVDLTASVPALVDHFCAGNVDDVRAWLCSLAPAQAPLKSQEVAGGSIERGEQLMRELACFACHAPADLDLAATTDHAHLAGFLREPQKRFPGLAHVPLAGGEADAIAAYLLRMQKQEGARSQGFAYECYERNIPNGDWPDVSGLEPSARGVVATMSIAVATRKSQYALQFNATLEVPADGEWQFATRSDDGSWLWIDDVLVVDNAGMKPSTRKNGRRRLSKGPHQLRVAYTQGSGGQELKVFWSGPGVDEQEIPGTSAHSSVMRLVPPKRVETPPPSDAVARGREAARAARCDACHRVEDPEFAKLPAPSRAKPWADLGAGECAVAAGPDLRKEVGALPSHITTATRLYLGMANDGCLACHVRDGQGGLPTDVQKALREIEDIGEEGIVPPDLTAVGRRLRPEWLHRVVAEGHKSREYVAMRMPAYGEDKARQYASWFADLDAKGIVDDEPEFSADAVELGRALAGTGGRNCISCHPMSGHDSLGPQGMDLAVQHQRLRPGWFRDWLLQPTVLRKNTRMPSLWLSGTEQDRVDADAIRTWLSLGKAAPLPKGIVVDAKSLQLVPIERPILHGAFLKGVSARCIAVGTPARTHFAYDLVEPRLAWIWRGAFLDSRGTWHGRAGKLVTPLGEDWQVVADFAIEGEPKRRLLGQRRTDDGYPVLRVACGEARYQDLTVPRLVATGSELVRTIRCDIGSLVINFPSTDAYKATIDGKPAGQHTLTAGQTLEIVYQW